MTIKVTNENNNIIVTPEDTNIIISTGSGSGGSAQTATNTANIATNTASIASNRAYSDQTFIALDNQITLNTADINTNVTNISGIQTALDAIETGPTYTAGTNINISATNEISSTASGTTGATPAQVTAIAANTAKVGITPEQATAISNNTLKVGITTAQATAISNNTTKVGITPEQATAISNNTSKVGITTAQATAISNNTLKVGITPEQATAISNNTSKVGITTAQATAISDNTSKVGITPEQATAITANTLKVSNVDHPLVQTAVPANAVFTDTIGATADQIAEIAANNNKVGITTAQANAIIVNTAKVGITAAQTSRLSNVGKNVPSESNFQNDEAFMIVMGSMNAAGDPEGNGKPGSSDLVNDINIMKEGRYFFSTYSKNNNNVFSAGHNKVNVFSQIAKEWKSRRSPNEDDPKTLPKLNIINCSYENNGFNINNYSLGNYNSDSKWDIFLRQDGGTTHYTIPEDTINTNNSLFYTAQKAIRSALIEFAKDGKRAFHVGTVWNGFEQEIDSDNYGLNSYPANIRFLRNMVDEALGLVDSDFYIWKPMSNSNDFTSTLTGFQDAVDDFVASENNVFLVNPENFSNYSENHSHLGLFNDHGSNSNANIVATDKKYYNESSLDEGANQVINNFVTNNSGVHTITRATAVCLDVKSLILSPKLLDGGNIYDHKLLRQTRFDLYGTLADVSFGATYDSFANTTSFSMDTLTRDVPLPSGTTTVLINGVSTTILSSSDQYSIVVSGDQTGNSSFATGDSVTATTETVIVDVLLNETDQTEE